MDETPDIPQPIDRWSDPGYVKTRFVLMLVILGALLFFIAALQRLESLGMPGDVFSESGLRGDLAMKLSYAYRRWADLVPPGPTPDMLRRAGRSYVTHAESSYERAVREAAIPRYVRRHILIQHETGQGSITRSIQLLEQSAARPEFSRDAQRRILEEAAMWRAILLKPGVPRSDVDHYRRVIGRLHLGWYEHLALADLYRNAGLAQDAARERAAASRSAGVSMALFIVIAVIAFMLGLGGIVVLVVYAILKSGGNLLVANPAELPANHGMVAVFLLEVFVFYLAAVLAVQGISGVFLAGLMLALKESGPTLLVIATAGSYVISGLVAVLYLNFRLRLAGWTREMLGWKAGNVGRNVMWGVAGYAAALPLLLIGAILSQGLSRYFPESENPVVPLFMQADTAVARWILLGLVALAAPFFEELFFRGVLLSSFRARWGRGWAIALSAAVFAAIHPFPVQFLPIFALGTVFAGLAYERGSLLPSMVAHAIQNGGVFIILMTLTGN